MVRIWHERFREFFIDPSDNITRQKVVVGGEAINVDGWLVTMSYLKTDGDHITAQALADVLKCAINVVKWSSSGKISLVKDVRPRPIPSGGLSKGKVGSMEVPDRTLWVTLHGEAHYRSLVAVNICRIDGAIA